MAEKTLININLNKNLKNNFEKVCQDLGMNPSVAINIFIRAVVRDKKIPFEVKTFSLQENTSDTEDKE